MPLNLDLDNSNIEVIVKVDTAVKCDDEEYQQYIETGNEDFLKLEGEPTRFVMKKNLSYQLAKKVKDSQVSFNKGEVGINFGYVYEEVRCALVDIKNPGDDRLKFKKASDGACSEKILELLGDGIIFNLNQRRQAALGGVENAETLKKK